MPVAITLDMECGEVKRNPHNIYILIGGDELLASNALYIPVYSTDSQEWRKAIRDKFNRVDNLLHDKRDLICYISPVVNQSWFTCRLVLARLNYLCNKHNKASPLRLVKW